MPELPEVETVCRGLNRLTLGRVIKGGEVLLNRSLAYPVSAEDFQSRITDCRFVSWQRRGKYLLGELRRNEAETPAGWLGCHLRMTGQLLWAENNRDRPLHTRVVIRFEGGKELRFVDIRTFGKVWLLPGDRPWVEVMTGLGKLGPEPFGSDFTPEYLYAKLKSSRRPLKNSLLDQALVAGLGNIYADEVLFFCGLHPTTPGNQVSHQDCERLHQQIQATLTAAIDAGGTSFSDYRQVTGINGNYGGLAQVYGRAGQPCRHCGTAIAKLKLGGRSAHFCPQCQPQSDW
ncbi:MULTISPECIES: DNA-formamidopyrimidine glycosylase [unclassified Synechocystis]|uniref:DNA-formamidopyrimidine glycosylase n=1 Tax=unclassified Synechocystis TaxID=2640012 RepID=UPI000424CC8B|nr:MULTISPECIES: DNA-formamidopyrimidine glycosylase [unclassified Synechocystis]AIE74397.1 Formamidopyrimidine-DNA glycosylase [Synechocystis sp. PCC 6714]MCT0254830.1 DNA-formamidopyrimidine glycosylase [Synechocystis sp. CS-94]